MFPNEAGLTQEVGLFLPVCCIKRSERCPVFTVWKIAVDPPVFAGSLSHTFHTNATEFPITLPSNQDAGGTKKARFCLFFLNNLMFSAHVDPISRCWI